MKHLIRTSLGVLVGVAIAIGSWHIGTELAHADTPSMLLDAGAGSGSAATPADAIHDPLVAPAATFDDAKAAKRLGWGAFAFTIALIATRLLGRAKSVPWLAWLGKGRTAVIVGAIAAVATTGYNALAEGGSLYAALLPAVMAGFAFWNSHPAATEPQVAAAKVAA